MADPESGESGEGGEWDGVEVFCGCGHLFRTRKSLRGGMTNCPRCRRAVEVPGGPEAMFWVLFGGGVLVVVGLAGYLYFTGNAVAGLVVLVAGALVIGARLLTA